MKKITFAEQAGRFLAEGATRKRNPLRPATLRTYKSVIDTVNPMIGNLNLQDVGNKALSEIVAKLAADSYSARSIQLISSVIKKIRKSAVNEDGDSLYPITWNADIIDAPSPVAADSTIAAEALQEAISRANAHDKALYVLLAGTGLRIAEALAIQAIEDDGVSTIWALKESKIIVRQQRTRTGLGPTKTQAGVREVDLAPELNDYLINHVASGCFMFPGTDDEYRNRLKKNGVNVGFHAFRRFRITHLNKMSAPSGLEYFWTGHAAGDVHGRYVKFGSEIETRKAEAIRVGLGFKLPEAS